MPVLHVCASVVPSQELTEEGLPFLILFYHPKDTTTANIFRQVVAKNLIAEKCKSDFNTKADCLITHCVSNFFHC